MIDLSFESELLIFFIGCRFLLFVANDYHDKSKHTMPKNDDVKQLEWFEFCNRRHESDQTSKRFNADIHGSIAILFRFL